MSTRMTKEDFDRHAAAFSAAFSGAFAESSAFAESPFVAAFGSFAEQVFASEQDPGRRLAKFVFVMLSSMTKGFWQGLRDGRRVDGDVVANALAAARDSFDVAMADLFAAVGTDLDLAREDFDRQAAVLLGARTEEAFAVTFCPLAERIFVRTRDPGRMLATQVFVMLLGVGAGLRGEEGAQA
jgi:hypothetical protein